MKKQPTSFYLSKKVKEAIKEAATKENRSASNWLEILIMKTLGIK